MASNNSRGELGINYPLMKILKQYNLSQGAPKHIPIRLYNIIYLLVFVITRFTWIQREIRVYMGTVLNPPLCLINDPIELTTLGYDTVRER